VPRNVRIIHFCPWADRLETVADFLARVPTLDLAPRVARPDLLPMARLDCDWHAENSRAFAAMQHPEISFQPALVTGPAGFLALAKLTRPDDEEWWLIFDGQTPQKLAGMLTKILKVLTPLRLRVGWYAFDEVSRTISAFAELAPSLDLLIHDEFPIAPTAQALLPKSCRTIHRSWVANVVPFSVPFNESPEDKIVFLGSKLGLTEHRQRQIDFLKAEFGNRFVAIHDHSVAVADRHTLNRFKVSVCPEGRKFTTPAMSATHTDRPFWSGCLGMIPVSENSATGDRLNALASEQMIFRYSHGNLAELKRACELALSASTEQRRKIYEHFNRFETVGTVFAAAIA